MKSFKNRWKIMEDEVINKKWKRIYVERKIKNIIWDRYAHVEIDLNSSYIYQKMDKLVDKKVYVPVWNMWTYVHSQGFINVFDLHQYLEDIIKTYHLPHKDRKIYTKQEKDYMKQFMMNRKLRKDRGLIVSYL
jgi:hypothetical protein